MKSTRRHLRVIFLLSLSLACGGLVVSVRNAAGQRKPAITYGAVYDCGAGRSQFKVISCKGEADNSECDVFYVNEYAPGGGSHVSTNRSVVIDAINNGCHAPGGAADDGHGEDKTPTGGERAGGGNRDAEDAGQEKGEAAPKEQPKGCSSAAAFKYIINEKYKPIGVSGPKGAEVFFHTFVVSAPVRYTDGRNGAVYARAYPVHTRYTVRSEYDDAFTEDDWDNKFMCYTDIHNECVCTEQVGSKAGESRRIARPR